MEVSTHSVIHKRHKNFVEFVATDKSKLDEIKRQAEDIRNYLTRHATNHGLTVAESPFSGSFAKKTGLKRYNRGNSEVSGQDVDLAFILEPKDAKGNLLGCQIQNFKRWIKESYPDSEVGQSKSSATIAFKSTKLSYDLVPLIKTSKPDIQKLIRTDGLERQSSVKKHIEFVKGRDKASENIAGVVRFNQCVRLMKWWKAEQQSHSGIFGNGEDDPTVPTFLLDLLCAKAYDMYKVKKTYPETLAIWFGYLADVVRNRREVVFSDYYSTKPQIGEAKWLVADPVDPTNNVVGKWQNDKLNELASWFETAASKMIQGIRKDGDGDNTGSMECLVILFGTAFKNNCE